MNQEHFPVAIPLFPKKSQRKRLNLNKPSKLPRNQLNILKGHVGYVSQAQKMVHLFILS